jgi:hypothetical protein
MSGNMLLAADAASRSSVWCFLVFLGHARNKGQ